MAFMSVRTTFPLLLVFALAGCGSISELNPFGPKDERLLGDRETVFSTNTQMMGTDAMRAASIDTSQRQSDWPQPGGNAANAPGNIPFAGGGARAWRASISGSAVSGLTRGVMRISSRPVVAGDKVFVYAPDGTVTALSASNGGRVWRTSLKPERESDPAAGGGVTYANGRVFVATGYGEAAALAAGNGQVIWRRELNTPARSAPTAGDGKVFVVSQKNQVFAINQEDGSEAFSYSGIPEQQGLVASAAPAVSGSTVVVPYSSGEVMAFSTESGEPTWQEFVTRSMRTLAVSGMSEVSGSPVIDNGVVYATGVAGRTIAVRLSNGDLVWERNIGSAHTPVVSGNAVFLIDLGDRMIALDRETGETMWMTRLPKPKKRRDDNYAGPVLAGGALWAVSNDGRLVQVDATNGRVVADKTIGSSAYTAPVVANGQMLIVSSAGEVTALR